MQGWYECIDDLLSRITGRRHGVDQTTGDPDPPPVKPCTRTERLHRRRFVLLNLQVLCGESWWLRLLFLRRNALSPCSASRSLRPQSFATSFRTPGHDSSPGDLKLSLVSWCAALRYVIKSGTCGTSHESSAVPKEVRPMSKLASRCCC